MDELSLSVIVKSTVSTMVSSTGSGMYCRKVRSLRMYDLGLVLMGRSLDLLVVGPAGLGECGRKTG